MWKLSKKDVGTQFKTVSLASSSYILFRLSSIAGSRLKDGNPIIADLSDDNRPLKIAERFSEIYDNEWTDAFDNLITDKSEIESIHILLDILQVNVAFQLCTDSRA